MKFCPRFYDYLYLDHYNGDIYLCQWMRSKKGLIGNLLKDKVEDAYNSEHANYLRATMDDQSFRFCRLEACPILANNELEEITEEEYEKRKKSAYYPTEINLAYDYVCNQSCETCRKSVFVPPESYADDLENIRKKITPYLNRAKYFSASGHGDPFASPYMMNLLENLHLETPDLQITLETNGVFCDEEHWERIKHLGKSHLSLVVTTNSFDEFTYRHVSRGGNFKKVMHNLDFLSELRQQGEINELTHSFVIQDRNFRELPSFIRRSFAEYKFDSVVLKPVYQWGTMDDDVFWFKDVLNPLHPYHEEYLEILDDPIMHDPRVYNFGGDTVHPARPYPVVYSGLFPYEKVKKGSKIVIYGAGFVGQTIRQELIQKNYCDIISWVDQCFDNMCTKSPNTLLNMPGDNYDKVVLATINETFAMEMRRNLVDMGISEEKIVDCTRAN